ncbi:MAG: hypothetical protein CL678_13115 [Bdellovibrionaceae bacterium]|nr:hypothetical protein [Pseudobdellovibrionaceae bacterium]|tara:strand:- start:82 stop:966 length:885 start_codon:yes stop_codon:yes gene_type:complete
MSWHPQIQKYLYEVELSLKHLSSDEKKRVLEHAEQRLRSYVDQYPNLLLGELFTALGAPQYWGQSICLELGIRVSKKAVGPVWYKKPQFIAFVVIGGLLGYLYLSFTPLYEWNEQTGALSLFGGHWKWDNVQFNSQTIQGSQVVRYSQILNPKETNQIKINLSSGVVHVRSSAGDLFRGECQVTQVSPSATIQQIGSTAVLDLSSLGNGLCDFEIPKGIPLALGLDHGQVQLSEWEQNASISVKTGEIRVQTHTDQKFDIQMNTLQGASESKVPSYPKGIPLSLSVEQGSIRVE